MKTVKVVLPDKAVWEAERRAKRESVEVTALCSGLLAEALLSASNDRPPTNGMSSPVVTPSPTTNDHAASLPSTKSNSFDVESNFPDCPQRSVEIAQRLVDEVLKLKGIRRVWRSGKRISFDPNFVDINYLLKQGRRRGLALSVYGEKTRFRNPPSGLKTGRTPSYSFTLVESQEDLEKAIQLVHQAYELKEQSGFQTKSI